MNFFCSIQILIFDFERKLINRKQNIFNISVLGSKIFSVVFITR